MVLLLVVVGNVAVVAAHMTVSPARTPVSVQFVIAAVVVPSYGLFAAVIVAVTGTAVIAAAVVALVDESV